MNDAFKDRRRDRKQLLLSAHCRTSSGLRDGGEITDITSEGCCIITNCLFFRVGIRVGIRPEGMETLTGIVRWIEGVRAGVEFDSPIYGPIVDHLVNHHPASLEVID